MLNVIFKNSEGKKRIIGTIGSESGAFNLINNFLAEHNYKSYYKRAWKIDDKTTVVDVGSWTEKFYIQEIS